MTGCTSCKKQVDSNGLPLATQNGSNTLGFLLNGKPWTPQGYRIASNLSIDYEPDFKNGGFNIVAYNFIPSISQQLTIGIGDSLNFMHAPATLSLSRNSLFGISYDQTCYYFNQYPDVNSSGSLTITKLDRINRIIAGTFNATLSKTGCDTIRITEGRFDMKF
jgi:hypothetical protein